jgi:type V secretory pathway adhesin AidA
MNIGEACTPGFLPGANDGMGPVGLGTTLGAICRLGPRGKWTFTGADGVMWQPYVQANIWRDCGAEATTTLGTEGVPLIEQATRLEFAGGVTARLGPRLSVFAQGGYQFATDERAPIRTAATASRATSACGSLGDAARAEADR